MVGCIDFFPVCTIKKLAIINVNGIGPVDDCLTIVRGDRTKRCHAQDYGKWRSLDGRRRVVKHVLVDLRRGDLETGAPCHTDQ